MRRIILILGTLIWPVAGYAGCATFETNPQDAPLNEICYQDTCDITALEYVCSNVTNYSAAYVIGWSLQCEIEVGGSEVACEYFWQGRPIDPAKNDFITITELE